MPERQWLCLSVLNPDDPDDPERDDMVLLPSDRVGIVQPASRVKADDARWTRAASVALAAVAYLTQSGAVVTLLVRDSVFEIAEALEVAIV